MELSCTLLLLLLAALAVVARCQPSWQQTFEPESEKEGCAALRLALLLAGGWRGIGGGTFVAFASNPPFHCVVASPQATPYQFCGAEQYLLKQRDAITNWQAFASGNGIAGWSENSSVAFCQW